MAVDYLIIFNDSPYGNQRAYNGLRLAAALAKDATVRVFLLGDGVTLALTGLTPVEADYHPQELLKFVAAHGGEIAACRTCMEARGLLPASLISEVARGTLDQLALWTREAAKVLVF